MSTSSDVSYVNDSVISHSSTKMISPEGLHLLASESCKQDGLVVGLKNVIGLACFQARFFTRFVCRLDNIICN